MFVGREATLGGKDAERNASSPSQAAPVTDTSTAVMMTSEGPELYRAVHCSDGVASHPGSLYVSGDGISLSN